MGLNHLWTDEGIQRAFDRRNEFQLTDSEQYFLDSLDRIATPDYVPTLQDILYCRKTTKGVIECRIEIDNRIFERISVILFLNKIDLLVQKVHHSDIHHYFPEFEVIEKVAKHSPGYRGN